MDREWSSNALGADLAGWDWFSLQLSDGSELMYYRLRRRDGTAGPFSSGTIVLPKGEKIALAGDEVRLQVRRLLAESTGQPPLSRRLVGPGPVPRAGARDRAPG